MNRLQNKKALITGGTTGIGLETARLFMNEGASVAITGTNPATLKAAQEELGQDALVLSCDAGNVAAQQVLADKVSAAFGSLDILVVNAGIVDMRPIGQWDEAAWDRSFGINLKGPWFLIQALLPHFANPASIVLNGSVNAHIGMPGTGVYGATKAGLVSMARTMSGELISRGIRVNAVSPGPIATPLYGKLGLQEKELSAVASSIQQQVPAARFGTPLEVAKTILFFASDEAQYLVGSELIIDGGMTTVH
jgi:NAD(P)-dependent dehydrogenase (short-subunit alcohol dehydrogenase family)